METHRWDSHLQQVLNFTIAADKDQNVVCVIGDGGFNMNIQELQTLLNYNVPLKQL